MDYKRTSQPKDLSLWQDGLSEPAQAAARTRLPTRRAKRGVRTTDGLSTRCAGCAAGVSLLSANSSRFMR
jgi:hypothetical protein